MKFTFEFLFLVIHIFVVSNKVNLFYLNCLIGSLNYAAGSHPMGSILEGDDL